MDRATKKVAHAFGTASPRQRRVAFEERAYPSMHVSSSCHGPAAGAFWSTSASGLIPFVKKRSSTTSMSSLESDRTADKSIATHGIDHHGSIAHPR